MRAETQVFGRILCMFNKKKMLRISAFGPPNNFYVVHLNIFIILSVNVFILSDKLTMER